MSEQTTITPERKKRNFVKADFVPSEWSEIEPYFAQLKEREINSVDGLRQWLRDWSELDSVLTENSRWIYVNTTIDTSNESAKTALNNLYANIYPHIAQWDYELKKKLIASPFTTELVEEDKSYFTFIRRTKTEIGIFRPENIALSSELNMLQSKFDEISGAQSIEHEGNELTFQQASVYLKETDRALRKEIFEKMAARRLQDVEALDELLTTLIKIRHQIALNAGYNNYIDYRFAELGRFDYTPDDCRQFHQSVKEVVMPVVNKIFERRLQEMKLDVARLWDLEVDASGKAPLVPFKTTEELVQKTIACFRQLDPYFAERIEIMNSLNYLDLGSRLNKGTGGYNMPMPEIGVPFIFMNAANSEQDVITMTHEGGHAIHTFLAHELELNPFKDVTSEIAEVASMGMELISMQYWNIFYANPDDLTRAKRNHLQYIINLLSRVCLGDSFQFWLYSNPNHTVEERRKKWLELNITYSPKGVDWSGYEPLAETGYQRILHFYIVPFYYIEYAFAQLGAIALLRNYKQDAAKTVEDYKKALSLGYTRTIPEFYETAGAKFDFSKGYIAQLMAFLEGELAKL
ncbi:MAG TPA: M3 family oligoendopeptidase [Chitinophagales bacterium]|nr:M3 family oligoendopeptidase [Chitinophagales bacterium]